MILLVTFGAEITGWSGRVSLFIQLMCAVYLGSTRLQETTGRCGVPLDFIFWLKAEEPEETQKELTNKLINKQLPVVNRRL